MDYKEYSRLRSIARKRIERAVEAGKASPVHIPTVKEIRASGKDPERYLANVKSFLESPSSSLAAIRKTPEVKFTVIDFAEKPKRAKKPISEAQRARRNEQKRRSKAKRAVEKSSASEAEARKKVGYLKALETVSKQWREAGVDVGNWLGVLSPSKAKSFVSYMDYRFSQGDYKNRYAVDTFIRDFGRLVSKGYNFDDIQQDFGQFLQKEKELKRNAKKANKYGVTEDEIDSVWSKFVKRV